MPTNTHIGSREAAELLEVSHATFNRWAKKGKIPTAIKAPGQTGLRLFNRKDIEDFASQHAAKRLSLVPDLPEQDDLAPAMDRHPAGSDLTA